MKKKCPCCSGAAYEVCCQPFHDGSLPETALQLMRSRYSAYALKKIDYIIHTTHPQSPYFERDQNRWEQAIFQFSTTTEFKKLEILDFTETSVHFAAYLRQKEQDFILEEKSQFQKVNGKWLYLSGIVHRK